MRAYPDTSTQVCGEIEVRKQSASGPKRRSSSVVIGSRYVAIRPSDRRADGADRADGRSTLAAVRVLLSSIVRCALPSWEGTVVRVWSVCRACTICRPSSPTRHHAESSCHSAMPRPINQHSHSRSSDHRQRRRLVTSSEPSRGFSGHVEEDPGPLRRLSNDAPGI